MIYPYLASEAEARIDNLRAQLDASEATSEERRKELLRTIEASNREWRRAENAEAELLQAQAYGAIVALQLEEAQADTVALDDDSALAFRKQIDTLTTQLAAVTKERDEARIRAGRNQMEMDLALAENARLLKERDEARAEMIASEEIAEKQRHRARRAELENARLRAAIAPTAENVEALAEALYRKRYANDWTECKTSDPSTAEMCRQDAIVFLAAIAARAGVKL